MLPVFISGSDLWGPLFAIGIFLIFLLVAGVVNLALRFITKRADQEVLLKGSLGFLLVRWFGIVVNIIHT